MGCYFPANDKGIGLVTHGRNNPAGYAPGCPGPKRKFSFQVSLRTTPAATAENGALAKGWVRPTPYLYGTGNTVLGMYRFQNKPSNPAGTRRRSGGDFPG